MAVVILGPNVAGRSKSGVSSALEFRAMRYTDFCLIFSGNGQTATATIKDECPTCNYGDLDMSPSLFNVFASPDQGVFQMEWDYIN